MSDFSLSRLRVFKGDAIRAETVNCLIDAATEVVGLAANDESRRRGFVSARVGGQSLLRSRARSAESNAPFHIYIRDGKIRVNGGTWFGRGDGEIVGFSSGKTLTCNGLCIDEEYDAFVLPPMRYARTSGQAVSIYLRAEAEKGVLTSVPWVYVREGISTSCVNETWRADVALVALGSIDENGKIVQRVEGDVFYYPQEQADGAQGSFGISVKAGTKNTLVVNGGIARVVGFSRGDGLSIGAWNLIDRAFDFTRTENTETMVCVCYLRREYAFTTEIFALRGASCFRYCLDCTRSEFISVPYNEYSLKDTLQYATCTIRYAVCDGSETVSACVNGNVAFAVCSPFLRLCTYSVKISSFCRYDAGTCVKTIGLGGRYFCGEKLNIVSEFVNKPCWYGAPYCVPYGKAISPRSLFNLCLFLSACFTKWSPRFVASGSVDVSATYCVPVLCESTICLAQAVCVRYGKEQQEMNGVSVYYNSHIQNISEDYAGGTVVVPVVRIEGDISFEPTTTYKTVSVDVLKYKATCVACGCFGSFQLYVVESVRCFFAYCRIPSVAICAFSARNASARCAAYANSFKKLTCADVPNTLEYFVSFGETELNVPNSDGEYYVIARAGNCVSSEIFISCTIPRCGARGALTATRLIDKLRAYSTNTWENCSLLDHASGIIGAGEIRVDVKEQWSDFVPLAVVAVCNGYVSRIERVAGTCPVFEGKASLGFSVSPRDEGDFSKIDESVSPYSPMFTAMEADV